METTDKPLVLITGAGGQLGREFISIQSEFPQFTYHFATKAELDVTVESWVIEKIQLLAPAVVINCAAYTNVERAEDDRDEAFACNAHAVSYLADACHHNNALFIHISTDYVFDGASKTPYTETDATNPLNVYGESKLEGERLSEEKCDRHIVIRTSWLYSTFGHNFFRTMLRLAKERGELSVVNDQISSPTYAREFARDIMQLMVKHLIRKEHLTRGTFHYAQEGEASWYDFASLICAASAIDIPIHAVPTGTFPTKARRPAYSKLDNTKWKKETGLQPIAWQDGVRKCVADMQSSGT